MGYTKGTAMENIRKLMQFYFLTESGTSDHYHQNPELFYILKGTLEVKLTIRCMNSGRKILF